MSDPTIGSFDVVVSDGVRTVTSAPAIISVGSGQTIVSHRASQSVAVGDNYTVIVANAAGSVTNAAGLLSVAFARLTNISILAALATAGDTFALAYAVSGSGTSGTKPLVIRAAGPSLGALGVPGTRDAAVVASLGPGGYTV